ncbi:MAG TPA: Uma2 family endonuclease [Nostoc sp.]|uniref:Uma2 family endonuclease n=1 Tax=Nostoc sp. TaxID=1180 RepID=UPI002D294384|nr:Uma2 family endonuclease [Nostoc sp.]HYX14811.1 Uma2 family endonuclease [Nostoc sp.]
MVRTPVKKLTFEEFLEQYPDGGIYELINGEIIPVGPTRAHKNVARFLMLAFNDEIRRLGLEYIADKDIIIRGCLKSLTGCKKALSVYAVNRK